MRTQENSFTAASRKIKVCIFCEKWGSGGIETLVLEWLRHVDRSRFEIRILSAMLESEAYLPKLIQLRVPITFLQQGALGSHISFAAFAAEIRDKCYDVIHFNLYEGLALGYVSIAKRLGVPIRIVHSHNAGLRKSLLKPLKLFLHYGAKTVFGNSGTEYLACSRVAAEFMFPRKIMQDGTWHFAPNGIDEKRFSFSPEGRRSARKTLGIENMCAVGCIGRLCYQKNQLFLLKVLAEMLHRNPKTMLLLVGEGEDRDRLLLSAEQFGVRDSVRFLGVSDQIPSILWALDVLAVPSRFEGLGIVAIEAQAAGLPVLCSEHVPRETEISDYIAYAPLGNCRYWAETLLSMNEKTRRDMAESVEKHGYSIQAASEQIQSFWQPQTDQHSHHS